MEMFHEEEKDKNGIDEIRHSRNREGGFSTNPG
jgi:hypothetical protein